MEKWVDVKGYEGLYQVSNMGNVKSLARITERKKGEMFVRERLLSKILWEGYFRVTLTKKAHCLLC